MNYSQLRGKTKSEHIRNLRTLQDWRCAICLTMMQRLVLDHCHKTDETRELLCHHCNVGLGQFEDKPGLLRRAAAYLERHARYSLTLRSIDELPLSEAHQRLRTTRLRATVRELRSKYDYLRSKVPDMTDMPSRHNDCINEST